MVREVSVAVTTATSIGRMKERSRPVSSIIRITVETGPCVVAANTAAAPSNAKKPGGNAGPDQGPAVAQDSAQHRADGQRGREQASRRPDPQA